MPVLPEKELKPWQTQTSSIPPAESAMLHPCGNREPWTSNLRLREDVQELFVIYRIPIYVCVWARQQKWGGGTQKRGPGQAL